MVNLSSHELTEQQISLLTLGLKFTPTPSQNQEDLIKDTKEFTRKLRLGEFFVDANTQNDDSIAKNKSNFMPPRGRNQILDKCIDHLHTFAAASTTNHNVKLNLTKSKQQALKELQQNSSIVIKEADKGGAIVIMDKDYYVEKISELLDDRNTYKEVPKNMDKTTLALIHRLISQYDCHLTDKEKDYLMNFENKSSLFYGLPKIHKCQEIIQAVKHQNQPYIKVTPPQDLKFRPIVAGPSSPTHRLSNFLDILLKPFLKHTKSYVRDDIDFLTQLPTEMKESEIFATFDICSLYSNISTELGLHAIEYWLNTYPTTLHSRIPTKFIKDSLQLILENNHFCFGDKNYLQTHGTAMGTKMAPTYANLTLAYLEEGLYNTFKEKYSDTIAHNFETSWRRYIDDCFIIWDNSIDDIENLHLNLNNLHPKLSFTMEHHRNEITFLDITIKKYQEKIITDIFHKPTDTKQYLHFRSCHPRSTKNNIPYNLARRICTIVIDPDLRKQRLEEMKNDLKARGYPSNLINDGILKASQLPVETLRTPTHTSDPDTCTFVSTFNPNNKNMWPIIRSSLDIMQSDNRCQRFIHQFNMINSRRQPANLKKLLTKARLETNPPTVKQCQDKRCGTCKFIITGDNFTFKGSNHPFYVKASMDCGSENLLYVLQCQGCLENYIGQTSDTLRTRMRVHKQHINTPEYRKLAVSQHIANCARNIDQQFKVFPFYKILQSNNSKTFRDVKEQTFIRKFKPLLNSLTYT